MSLPRPLVIPLLFACIGAGCRAAEGGVDARDQERFVEVNVGLRGLPQGDVPARDSLLTAHGVSEEWLLALSGRLAARPEHLADTWDEIQRRLGRSPDGELVGAVQNDGGTRTPVEGDTTPRIRRLDELPSYSRPQATDQPRLSPSFDEVPPPELSAESPKKRLPIQPQ